MAPTVASYSTSFLIARTSSLSAYQVLSAASEGQFRDMLRRCLEARKLDGGENDDVLIQPEFLEMFQANSELNLSRRLTREEEIGPPPPQGQNQNPGTAPPQGHLLPELPGEAVNNPLMILFLAWLFRWWW